MKKRLVPTTPLPFHPPSHQKKLPHNPHIIHIPQSTDSTHPHRYHTRVFTYVDDSSNQSKRFVRLHYKSTYPYPSLQKLPCIFFIHGGFWKNKYHIDNNCHHSLIGYYVSRGFVFCDVEYRTRDDEGGGYPGTCNDIRLAYDYLLNIVSRVIPFDPLRIIIMGHSAGGMLALWLSCQRLVKCRLVVGIAPCADLIEGVKCKLGDDGTAVLRFMKCDYKSSLKSYKDASPSENLPLPISQLIVSGGRDVDVPASYISRYIKKCNHSFVGGSSSSVEYLHFEDADHYDLTSSSHEVSVNTILSKVMKYI